MNTRRSNLADAASASVGQDLSCLGGSALARGRRGTEVPLPLRGLVFILVLASMTFAQGYGTGTQSYGTPAGYKPAALDNVGITDKPGAKLPLDLVFTDDTGKQVKLGDYFKSGKPVVLNLVYFECPMLCTFALNGELNVLKELAYTPGDEFEAITVSFSHDDTAELAGQKKANYVESLGRPEAAKGWHFLTSPDEATIRKLTDAVGFTFRWVEDQGQYAHSSALILLTPDGRIHRYLHGIQYDASTLRLSLVEASQGKIGSVSDKVQLMFCFAYDPTKGAYGPAAMKIMRAGGLLTLGGVGVMLVWLLKRERNRKTAVPHVQAQPA